MKESLLIFAIPCYVFLGIFIYVQNTHKHVLATIFKGLASICFFLIPIVGLTFINKKVDIIPTICLFIGLGFGVLGDVFLNLRDLFKKPIKDYISLGGVVAFFIGHVFYLIHLFMIIANKSYCDKKLLFIPILAAIIITLLLTYLVHKFIDKSKKEKSVAIVYISIISLLSCMALFNLASSISGHDLQSNYFIVMFVACVAFALSDVILIFNSFGRHPRPWISALNLVLYYSAQILVGVSILLFYI